MLSLIAAFKFVKAAAAAAVAFSVLGLLRPGRAEAVQGWLEAFVLEPGHRVLAELADRALVFLHLAQPSGLKKLVVGAFLLAVLFAVEGVGLALARRWAEWLTAGVTSSYLPVEVSALWHRWTVLGALTIALNVAVVLYLLAQLRRRPQKAATNRGRRR